MPRNPRILFVSHEATRTGAPIVLLSFMRWLRANTDFELGTILRRGGPLEGQFRELGPCTTIGVGAPELRAQARTLASRLLPSLPRSALRALVHARAVRSARAGSYDLVYSNTITNGDVLAALAHAHLPVVTHVHELSYVIRTFGERNLQRVKAHSTRYVAASGAVFDCLTQQHGIAKDKITVVHAHLGTVPAVPSAELRAAARRRLGIPDGAFVVGGSGADTWRKGKDLVPQLLLELRRRLGRSDMHFVWVGPLGSDEERLTLERDLAVSGMAPFFHATGEVADPFELYASFDAFGLLSREDPYPLVCLEAAAMELPIVCFADSGGMPAFVKDQCGLVAPYLDVNAFAEQVVRLADDAALRSKLGGQGRAQTLRKCTLATTGPQLLQVIRSLL